MEHFVTVAKSLPEGTKGTIGLIAVCTLLNTVGAAGFLTLVPNSTVASGHIWNLVTFALVEQGLLQAAVSAAVLGMVGRVAEPLWGTGEFVKFLVLVNLFTGICLWVDCYILFQGSGNEAYLLNPKMGFQAGVGALFVAAKQLCGEQELGGGVVRAKHLPSLYAALCAVLFFFFGAAAGWIGLVGTWSGWCYLRFYQTNGERLGDMANSFAFATFFPDFLQEPVAVPAAVAYNLACMFKLVTRQEVPSEDDEDTFYTQQASALGTNTAVAERRRLKAQKELEARLSAAGDDEEEAFEDFDEDDLEGGLTDVVDAIVGEVIGDTAPEKES